MSVLKDEDHVKLTFTNNFFLEFHNTTDGLKAPLLLKITQGETMLATVITVVGAIPEHRRGFITDKGTLWLDNYDLQNKVVVQRLLPWRADGRP